MGFLLGVAGDGWSSGSDASGANVAVTWAACHFPPLIFPDACAVAVARQVGDFEFRAGKFLAAPLHAVWMSSIMQKFSATAAGVTSGIADNFG